MNDLERGGSPVATDRVATFKISFFSGVKSSNFQWRVINSKYFLERLVWSENGIHSTTYLLGVWLYGFLCDGGCMGLCCEMLNLVVLGQILWFRFRS